MKNILAIILLLTSVNTFAQNKKWTLQQCVNHALESNIIIKQTENTLLSNDQDIKAAKGSFLPTVSGIRDIHCL